MKRYCIECDDFEEVELKKVKKTLPVKGENITLEIEEFFCVNCGEPVYDEVQDSDNLRLFYDEYRRVKGLLTSSEIIAIRERYGLSQTALAKLLGFGDKTIARYERGYIQDESPNIMMSLLEDEHCFSIIYEKNKDKLTAKEQEKVKKALNICSDNIIKYEISAEDLCNSKYNTWKEYSSKSGREIRFKANFKDVK